MANSRKNKGDTGEREAVEVLVALAPDLAIANARRLLGAGRRADEGDLRVFDDVAIQVKAWALSRIGMAISESARTSVQQAFNNDHQAYALGMVKIDGARKDSVRWLACVVDWPTPIFGDVIEFNTVGKLLPWIRDDQGPYGYRVYPRVDRLARLNNTATPTIVAPLEAWIAAYRAAVAGPVDVMEPVAH